MTTSTQTITRNSRPWIWIVAAFTVMIAFWSALITIAVRNHPASVPVTSAVPPTDARD